MSFDDIGILILTLFTILNTLGVIKLACDKASYSEIAELMPDHMIRALNADTRQAIKSQMS